VHERLAEVSYPTFVKYGQRIGADVVIFGKRAFHGRHPVFEKFQIRNLLSIYDAVCWIDCDAVVHPGACSVFDLVPQGHFAAVDEGEHGTIIKWDEEIKKVGNFFGITPRNREARGYKYFNSGVFVVWRGMERLFDDVPPNMHSIFIVPEQTTLNARLAASEFPFYSLSKTWNMTWVPMEFEKSHVVHMGGRPKSNGPEGIYWEMVRVVDLQNSGRADTDCGGCGKR
jgi:hypothetical protein